MKMTRHAMSMLVNVQEMLNGDASMVINGYRCLKLVVASEAIIIFCQKPMRSARLETNKSRHDMLEYITKGVKTWIVDVLPEKACSPECVHYPHLFFVHN